MWHGSCFTGWKWVIEFLVPCWDGCHGNWQSPPARCVWLSSVFRFSSLLLSAFLSLLYKPSYSYSNVAEVRGSSHGTEFHIYCYQRVHFSEYSFILITDFIRWRIISLLLNEISLLPRCGFLVICPRYFSLVSKIMKWSVSAQKREKCGWDFPDSIHGLIVGSPIWKTSPVVFLDSFRIM